MFSLKASVPNYGTFSTASDRPSLKKAEPKVELNAESETPPPPDFPYIEIRARKHPSGSIEILKMTEVNLFSSDDGTYKKLSCAKDAKGLRTLEDRREVTLESVKADLDAGKYNCEITYV